MKITTSNQAAIIDHLKSGKTMKEIAVLFGTSRSSISRIKSENILVTSERVECKLCGKKFKQITGKHLARSHGVAFNDYQKQFPDSVTSSCFTKRIKKLYRSKNKGKTFGQIYGEQEGANKRDKISKHQIGREAPKKAGTGLAGTRRDTGTYARSTYEANLDRIFQFENKKYADEFSTVNPRVFMTEDGEKLSYQPDRVDLDGLFHKGAFIEVKGYMYPEDWRKICLFRKHNPDSTLLVVSPDPDYADVSYIELKRKYMSVIPLWETETQNIKTRPDLYKVDYIPDASIRAIMDNYPLGINKSIIDRHEKFVARKCLSYCLISLGAKLLVEEVSLIAISNRRPKAGRRSSGEYNFEMWRVDTVNMLGTIRTHFWVTNLDKTNVFYCHDHDWITSFFDENSDMTLIPGRKNIKTHENIDENLWTMSDENTRYILQMANDKLKHRGIFETVNSIKLIHSQVLKSKAARRNMEKWEMTTNNQKIYFLDNFDGPTDNYILTQQSIL
jgi:hypothetical protein